MMTGCRHKFSPCLAALVLAWGPGTAVAQDDRSLFDIASAGVTYGPYVRLELGYGNADIGDAYWKPRGATDPQVFFDLNADKTPYGSLSFGFDWMNGFRSDLSIASFGTKSVSGGWSYTSPPTPGPHADIATEVESLTMMANLYYSPLEQMGRNQRFQPYLTAGIGVAQNTMGDWTRSNPASPRPTKTYEGNSQTDAAWTVGIGAAWRVFDYDARPVMLDASLRYFDLGEAKGSSVPKMGSGSSQPREPIQFKIQSTVFAVGLRVPLQRY